ncbi:MAG: polysaccharide biosynthesis C-terminal domain-containing protein, partial [Eubacteriales bacterium]
VLHNFASYLDSENMVRMKSLPTMFTALFGAAINLILNLILIPILGGIGAAIATYVSYLATFVTRAVIVRKSIEVHPMLTLLNNILLMGMVILTMTQWHIIWIVGDLILLGLLIWLDHYPILFMAKGILNGLKGRLKARK